MINTKISSVDVLCQDLALAHRMFAQFNWDDLTYTHLTARHPDRDSYFIMPFGLLFCEVMPDQLLEVDFSGNLLNGPKAGYNPTGHVIHGSIYQARPDVNAIFHSHTTSNVAVATQKEGLLPLSQWALLFYERMGFHAYDSLALHADLQGSQLVKDLGQHPILLMRNHGIVVAGKDIAETFYMHYHLEKACELQCKLLAMNHEYCIPSHELSVSASKDLNQFETNNGHRDWQALKRKFGHLIK